MLQNQRRSIEHHNRSNFDDRADDISLNYTSSIKTGQKDGTRARYFSTHEKPDRKYQYSHDFIERNDYQSRTPHSNTFNVSQGLNLKQNIGRNNSHDRYPRDRQSQDSKDRIDRDLEIINHRQYQEHSSSMYNKNKRRGSKNYYGGVGTHGISDIQEEFGKRAHIDENKGGEYNKSGRQIFSFTNKDRPNFEQVGHKYIDQNKQNTRNAFNKRGSHDNSIKNSFEKLNQDQILQKIGRINKLNGQINNRLQALLAKVSTKQ